MSSEREGLTGMDAFVYDFGWGALQHHFQPCEECDGSGLSGDTDEHGVPENCIICDGLGRERWGSFYEVDVSACAHCKGEELPVAAMFSGGSTGEVYVCLPCYVIAHRDRCGCDAWKTAEAALPPSDAEGGETP